jgi:three-Cys-motif partner protein
MIEQIFGGNWTEDKLSRLEKYLLAYRSIFTGNIAARFFTTWYVDAFAGTGIRFAPEQSKRELTLFKDVYEDVESAGYLDGSARIALGLKNPFDRYLFIEKSKSKDAQLRASIERDYPALLPRCEFRQGDANTALQAWCKERNWGKERAVVFLDPYGMQVDWRTIEALAATKAVDLWYLFPLGIGVARLLTRDGAIEESWQRRLNTIFGTTAWRERFYTVRKTASLFGDVEDVNRAANEEQIERFISERLKGCFVGVAKGLILRNSRSSPLYLLCFASANEKGAPIAVRIAQQILGG